MTPLDTQPDPTAPPKTGSYNYEWFDASPVDFPLPQPKKPRDNRKVCLLWDNQNGFCWYCDDFTILPERCGGKRPVNMATVEHVIPRCLGGGPLKQNKVMACNQCNGIMSLVDSWLLATFGRGT